MLEMLMPSMFPEKTSSWCHQAAFAQEVLLSVCILGETLEWAGLQVYDENKNAQFAVSAGLFAPKDGIVGGPFLSRRMIEEGWCPSEISYIWKVFYLSGLYASYLLGPPNGRKDHAK